MDVARFLSLFLRWLVDGHHVLSYLNTARKQVNFYDFILIRPKNCPDKYVIVRDRVLITV